MRLRPVAPLNIVNAAQDAVVADVAIREGVFVLCVMRPAGMDQARFEQPQAFRPARWLQGEGQGGVLGAKRVVMPFGAGPRVCPGRYLPLAEIKMVMAMLLRNFEVVSVTTPEGGPREKLALTMSPYGLSVVLRERS